MYKFILFILVFVVVIGVMPVNAQSSGDWVPLVSVRGDTLAADDTAENFWMNNRKYKSTGGFDKFVLYYDLDASGTVDTIDVVVIVNLPGGPTPIPIDTLVTQSNGTAAQTSAFLQWNDADYDGGGALGLQITGDKVQAGDNVWAILYGRLK